MNGLTKWSAIAAIAVAVPTLAVWSSGVTGNFVEHWQTVGANQKWIALAEFKRLSLIKSARVLTFEEWATWCELGLQLRFFKMCPPR